ncbi:hypothetical protein T03_14060 [Trichinella britovi]|uniref:Uncharacterized protein n=1 Tax=Trichinella britovi TaxID=45882 RepID=A0A0V1DAG2_TRIBR|nr:hypothetical protein T03_14060 [Trichinella britovi]
MILREKFCVTESWDVRFSFGYRRSDLHHSETMDCCQKIHIDEGLAIRSPQSMLASGVLTNLVPSSNSLSRVTLPSILVQEALSNSDDSDTNATTVETIPLKTYLELNECVDHLERFIKAAESADKGIHKVISVVR